MADSQAIARELRAVLKALERERAELDDKIRLMKRTLESLGSAPKSAGSGAEKQARSKKKPAGRRKAKSRPRQTPAKAAGTRAKKKKSKKSSAGKKRTR